MIPDSVKQRIRESVDIVDVVREYGVELKRTGHSWKGLCPFHAEKTASFNVNPEGQFYKCYGCGKGGDVYAFVMAMDGLDFPAVAKHLADRCGIPLKYDAKMNELDRWKVHLYQLNTKAMGWFEEALWATKAAHEYVRRRGIDEKVARRWHLGYCPPDAPLVAKNVAVENHRYAVAAGLLGESRDGKRRYEFFHGRIIFPIFDIRGRCVGFGGRNMDESLPKYLNTPQNALFSKQCVLYGVHEAHKTIRTSHEAIVVEGYTDVLACHAHGVDNVVGTLGTALTDEHVKRLRGIAERVVILRDMDNAGESAAERSMTVLINGGMDDVRIAELDDDRCKDSADYLKTHHGPHDLRAVVKAAVQPFDFRMACAEAVIHKDSAPERQARIIRTMVKWVASIKDEILKIQYRRALAERMHIDEVVLFAHAGPAPAGVSAKRQAQRKLDNPVLIAEHEILRWLLHRPEHLGMANGTLDSASFVGLPEQQLAAAIRAVVDDAVFESLPDNKFDFMRAVLAKLAGQTDAMQLCMSLADENPLGMFGQERVIATMISSLERERTFREFAECEQAVADARKAKDKPAEEAAQARLAAVRERLLGRVSQKSLDSAAKRLKSGSEKDGPRPDEQLPSEEGPEIGQG
jgi:DNA primase